MCLLARSPDGSVDVLYLQEWLCVNPKGSSTEPFIELHINGFVRLIRQDTESPKVVFFHRGSIEFPKEVGADLTSQWETVVRKINPLRAHDIATEPQSDWLFDLLQNDEDPRVFITPRENSGNEPGFDITYGEERRRIQGVVPAKISVGEIRPRCLPGTEEPVYSTFEVTFNGGSQRSMYQVFRIAFRTRSGVRTYPHDLRFTIEGPERARASILRLLELKEAQGIDTKELTREVEELHGDPKPEKYDAFILSHPNFPVKLEARDDATMPRTIWVDGPPQSVFQFYKCPAACLAFDLTGRRFTMSFIAENRAFTRSMGMSAEVKEALETLQR